MSRNDDDLLSDLKSLEQENKQYRQALHDSEIRHELELAAKDSVIKGLAEYVEHLTGTLIEHSPPEGLDPKQFRAELAQWSRDTKALLSKVVTNEA
jgi:hypothetical protein